VGRARLAAAACARTRQENKRDGRAFCCESDKKNTPTLFPNPPPILRHELDDCINGAAVDCIAVAATMVILLLQEAPFPRQQQLLLLLLRLLPGSTRAVELWSFTPVLEPLLLAAATLDDIAAVTCIVLFVAPPLPSFLNTLVTETVIIIFKLLLDHPKQRKLHESLSLSRSIDLDADHELQSKCRKARKTKRSLNPQRETKNQFDPEKRLMSYLDRFGQQCFFWAKFHHFWTKKLNF
jgi:hypothetical protein